MSNTTPAASSPGSAALTRFATLAAGLPDCTVVRSGATVTVYTDRGVAYLLAQRGADGMGLDTRRFKATPSEAKTYGGHTKLVVTERVAMTEAA